MSLFKYQLVVTTTTSWHRCAWAGFTTIATAFFAITVFAFTRWVIASHDFYIITKFTIPDREYTLKLLNNSGFEYYRIIDLNDINEFEILIPLLSYI